MTEKELAERLRIEANTSEELDPTDSSIAVMRQAAAALEGRNKRAEIVKAGWIRAAEEALAGDMGALRNRVALAKEGMPEFTEQQLLGPEERNGSLTNSQIKHMVDRFLGWRLPKPWHPDNGISYARPNYAHAPADHDWPTGTNLFDAGQAEAMIRYMIEGIASHPTAPAESGPGEEIQQHLGWLKSYLDNMGLDNWKDMRDLCKRQIVSLSEDFNRRLATADGREVREIKSRIAAKGYLTYCDDDCVGDQHSEAHERREVVCRIDSDD